MLYVRSWFRSSSSNLDALKAYVTLNSMKFFWRRFVFFLFAVIYTVSSEFEIPFCFFFFCQRESDNRKPNCSSNARSLWKYVVYIKTYWKKVWCHWSTWHSFVRWQLTYWTRCRSSILFDKDEFHIKKKSIPLRINI